MPDRVEALVLQMSADIRKLETGLAKARQKANSELGAVEKRFDKSSQKIKAGADGIGGHFERLTSRIPFVGDALSALGPAGLAAGTGLLAVGFAAKAVYDGAEKARHAIDELNTSAMNIATSAETFQALKASAAEKDVDFTALEKGMAKLQIGAAEAAFAQGDLYNALKKVNPQLLQEIILSETQEDRWDALNRAISAQESQMAKVAIARAAFGKQAGQLVRLLDGEENSVAKLTNRFRDMGLILSEDLVAAVAEADDRMTLAAARMEAQNTRAAAGMIPVVEALTNAWTGLNIAVGEFFDRMNDPAARQIGTLQADLRDQEAAVNRAMDNWKKAAADVAAYGDPGNSRAAQGALKRLQNEMESERKTFYEEQSKFFALRNLIDDKKSRLNKGPTSDGTLKDEAALDAAEREAEKRAAKLEEQRQRAAQVLGELGDITELVAAKEKDMNELVAAGLITRDQAAAAVEKYRATFDKVTAAEKEATAAQKEWQAILDRSRTPIENAEQAILEFWDAVQSGTIGGPEQAAEVLKVLTANLDEARAAAKAATPEFQAVAAARLAIAEAAMGAMGAKDRIGAERQRLTALVGQDGFTQAEADQAMSTFIQKETAGLRDATRDSVKEGLRQGLSTDDWGSAIRDIIANSIVDGLDDVINRLADMLTDFILGAQDGSGGNGALGDLFAMVGGFFGGARAGGGPTYAGRDYLVGEKGPEILRMGAGQNGQVFNAGQVNAMNTGGAPGGATFVDASIRVGGVDMATWPQVQAALALQAQRIAAKLPGGVNATLADNRRQKRRF